MTTRSIAHLGMCASVHLDEYCSPTSRYAWPAYDENPHPSELTATDLLASAMLDAPVRGRLAILMLADVDGPYANLWAALHAVVTSAEAHSTHFEHVNLEDDSSWRLAHAAFEACQYTKHIKTTTVSKILHRKLPRLVPINDRFVREFYDVTGGTWRLWPLVQRDVLDNAALLDEWRANRRTPSAQAATCPDCARWTSSCGCIFKPVAERTGCRSRPSAPDGGHHK